MALGRRERPSCLHKFYGMNRILLLTKHLKTKRHFVAENQRLVQFQRAMSSNNGNDEELKAKVAQDNGEETIFDKIIRKEIPSTVVFEDDYVLAFRDVNPQAPTHILLIPKKRDGLTQISKAVESHQSILGKLMYTATVVAKQENLDNGYRIVVNDGVEGCQSVYHLHIHLIGGRQMKWSPG